MAVPTVAGVSGLATGAGNVTPTLPSHQADDILLALCETDDEAVSCSTTGWAEIPSSMARRAGGTRLTWFWKRATSGAETNPTITGTTNHKIAYAVVLRGCFTSGNPWNVVGTPNDGITDPGTTAVTIPALTTTKLDCLILMGVAGGNDTASAQFSSPANATLSNFTTQKNESSTSGNGGGHILCTGELATPGSSGNFTATHSGDDNWAGVQIAFRPPEPFTPQAVWQR